MSRQETRFNLDISESTAKEAKKRGADSQKARGIKPGSGNLDEMKLTSPIEEMMMDLAGKESQRKKLENKKQK